MRKSEIEKARRAFMDSGASTTHLRARIARDLEPIRNAYEIAASAWDAVEVQLQNVQFDESPGRSLRQLAATMKDLATTLTTLRGEARTTTAYHAAAPVEARQAQAAPAQLQTDVDVDPE